MLCMYEANELEKISYTLSPQQLAFVKSPQQTVELCMRDANRFPVVYKENNEIIAYCILQLGEEVLAYTSEENAIIFRAFSVQQHYIGRGYAKKVLTQLPNFIKLHFPTIRHIVLAVDENNIAARHLYEKIGYCATGRQMPGRNMSLHVLKYDMKNPL